MGISKRAIGEGGKHAVDHSAMAQWAALAGWSREEWVVLLAGSVPDSARLFESLVGQKTDWARGREARELAWRFGFLPVPWRAWAGGLDEARLLELLVGNLSADDSGVDPRYIPERIALRMLCVLRAFKENDLSMEDPDPRINSLRRIKLGGWREFPEVSTPGLASSGPQAEALACARLSGAMECFGQKALMAGPRAAIATAWSLGLACSAMGMELGYLLSLSATASVAGGALGVVVGCNPWVLSLLRRFFCRRVCERALRWLACPASCCFEEVAVAGLGSAAKAAGVNVGSSAPMDSKKAMAEWTSMGQPLRKIINAARQEAARESLLAVGAAVAGEERALIEAQLEDVIDSGEHGRRALEKKRSQRL